MAFRPRFTILLFSILGIGLGLTPAFVSAQTATPALNNAETSPENLAIAAPPLDIDPQLLQQSPTLRKWLQEVPNVLEDIRHDPSFRTRLRIGYSEYPSNNDQGGLNVAVDDIFIGSTGMTVSGNYDTSFRDRQSGGADLQYYLLPLGNYVNVAPLVGFRSLVSDQYHTNGVNVGAKLMLALSRDGAADISLSQSFVSPGGADEVGISTLTVGYALTPNLRLAADIQKQNSRASKDSRVSLGWEWLIR